MGFKNYYGKTIENVGSVSSDGVFDGVPVNYAFYGECKSVLINQYSGLRTYYTDYIPLGDAEKVYAANSGQTVTFYEEDKSTIVSVAKTTETINFIGYKVYNVKDTNAKYVRVTLGSSSSLGDLTSEGIKANFDGYALYLDPPNIVIGNKADVLRPVAKGEYEKFIPFEILKDIHPLIGKYFIAMGDSLTQYAGGRYNYDYGFLSALARKYNMRVENRGTGGTSWGYSNDAHTGSFDGDCACEKVDRLIESGVVPDFLTLEYGANQTEASDGDPITSTSSDTTSRCGAIKYCIERLQAYAPPMPLGIVLPTHRNEGNVSNARQEEINDMIVEVAKQYSVPVLDLFHEGNLMPFMFVDGLHWAYDGDRDRDSLRVATRKYANFLMNL